MENADFSRYSALLSTSVLAVAILIGLFMVLLRVDQYLQIRAVEDCARISTFQKSVNSSERVSAPVMDVYKSCLKDKGYSK